MKILKMSKNLLKFISIFLSPFISFPLLSYKIINVEEFDFGEDNKGICVCVFDTDKQKYRNIDYYRYSSYRNKKIRLPHTYVNNDSLEIFLDGSVKVSENFDMSNYIIRARKIKYTKNEELTKNWKKSTQNRLPQTNMSLLYPGEISVKKGDFILKTLNEKFSTRKYDSASEGLYELGMPILFVGSTNEIEITNFSKIIPNSRIVNNKQREYLGELATELTMISYGYFKKHYSKYDGNHGPDGVYENSIKLPDLFITESKCRNEIRSAKKYMDLCLSEQKIRGFVEKMGASQNSQKTGETIKKYIHETPKKIFKFVHRILPDGKSQCLVEEFSLHAYTAVPFLRLTVNSSKEQEYKAFKKLARLYSTKQLFKAVKEIKDEREKP